MNNASNKLVNYICELIKVHNKPISFAKFMEAALYHPEWGYYNSPHFTLGQKGDFITAPEISPLFAQCLARQFQQIFLQTNQYHLLEIGAGTGRLAKDLLCYLANQNDLPDCYYIYEKNPRLIEKQKEFLKINCPEYLSRIFWLPTLPKNFDGIIIANEVLDAQPVHCFHLTEDIILERCVGWDHLQFIWQLQSPTTTKLAEEVNKLRYDYQLPSGYSAEINLQLAEFLQPLIQTLNTGFIFLIDYGYHQAEYYHPERQNGTLTCFHQHHYHHDPLSLVGLQDITAHVDFTRVIELAAEMGCTLAGYTSQASFLLNCGLIELAMELEKNLSDVETYQLHQAMKLLTLPTEMGERIKVMALTKHPPQKPLLGFQFHDRSREL